jgi:hypothetical protein
MFECASRYWETEEPRAIVFDPGSPGPQPEIEHHGRHVPDGSRQGVNSSNTRAADRKTLALICRLLVYLRCSASVSGRERAGGLDFLASHLVRRLFV